MDTWTVIATDMDTHAVEATMVVIVEVTCTLIAEIITQDHATLMLTAHAEDTDMDTHAVDTDTVMTATLTSETTDTHQAPHVVMDSTCTTTVTVVTAATTVEYTDTWTVIATDMDTHAVEATMVVIVEVTCTLIAEIITQDHATLMLTAHAEDTDMDTHAVDTDTVMTATLTSETMDTHQAPHVVMDSTCTTTVTVVTVVTTVEYTDTWTVI